MNGLLAESALEHCNLAPWDVHGHFAHNAVSVETQLSLALVYKLVCKRHEVGDK